MKIQTIIFAIVIAIAVLYFFKTTFLNQTLEGYTDTTRPSMEYLPKQEVENDKLVLVDHVSPEEIDSILNGFCNMYNNEKFQALPRAYKITDSTYAITFPYDIDFIIYCYFINYVNYPMGFDKSFEVTGWATTRKSDPWVTEQSANKNVILFIPTNDTEHDNVYMTTSDNIGYKLGFASGEEKQSLNSPNKLYVKQKYQLDELDTFEQKNYR